MIISLPVTKQQKKTKHQLSAYYLRCSPTVPPGVISVTCPIVRNWQEDALSLAGSTCQKASQIPWAPRHQICPQMLTARMAADNRPRVGGTNEISSSFCHFLHILFSVEHGFPVKHHIIFDRCHCSLAAVTSVRYGCDTKKYILQNKKITKKKKKISKKKN